VAYFELISHDWKWPELKSIATFGLAVAFSKLHYSQHVFKDKRLYKIDETLISCALDNKVFRFLNQNVAPSVSLHNVVCIIFLCTSRSLNPTIYFSFCVLLSTSNYIFVVKTIHIKD